MEDPTDDLLRFRAMVDAQIRQAVELNLMPRLSQGLQDRMGFDPLELYGAIDAISMFLERETRGLPRHAILSPEGLLVPGPLPLEELLREIRVMTGSPHALELYGWILEALREVPQLLPGASGTSRGLDVEFQVTEREIDADLTRLWTS